VAEFRGGLGWQGLFDEGAARDSVCLSRKLKDLAKEESFGGVSADVKVAELAEIAIGRTRDPDTEDAAGFPVEHQLGHALGAVDGDGAAARRPGELRDLDVASFGLRLRFRQTGPRDLRIGEHHRGNRERFEDSAVALDRLDCHTRFV